MTKHDKGSLADIKARTTSGGPIKPHGSQSERHDREVQTKKTSQPISSGEPLAGKHFQEKKHTNNPPSHSGEETRRAEKRHGKIYS